MAYNALTIPLTISGTDVIIYLNGSAGSDSNDGRTPLTAVATLDAALKLWPRASYGAKCRIIADDDGVPRTYTFPVRQFMLPQPVTPGGSPPVFIGKGMETLVASQAETVGGSLSVFTGAFPNNSLTDNPLAVGATTVNVTLTTGFPTRGEIKIDSEIIKYTGITATSFTGCTRGQYGTIAASHLLTAPVLLFLAGYWIRQVAPATTVSDNPLSSVAVTVNVASTVVYPLSGTVRIENEFISYARALPSAGVGDSFTRATGSNLTFAQAGSVTTLTGTAALFTAAMVGAPIVIAGATTPANNGTFTVASFISSTQITYTNAGGVAEAGAGTWTLNRVFLDDSAALFVTSMVGESITIAGATTPANNGTFVITSFVSSTQISYTNASGVAEAYAGTWTVGVGTNRLIGCSRGQANTTAAAHVLGSAVTLVGAKRQIQKNTATTVTLNVNISASVNAVGETYVIERAGTRFIQPQGFNLLQSRMGFLNLVLDVQGVIAHFNCDANIVGCEFILNGNQQFWAKALWNVNIVPWQSADGVDSPFLAPESNAGNRFVGPGTFNFNFLSVLNGNGFTFLGANVNVLNNSAFVNPFITAYGGVCTVDAGASFVANTTLSVAPRALYDNFRFVFERGAVADLGPAECKNATGGFAITVGRNATATLTDVIGTNNASGGVNADADAEIRVDSLTTVTGVASPNTTTTDAPLSSVAVTIAAVAVSTTGYPASGTLRLDSEIVTYTGVTATTFTGCRRGQGGTTNASHVLGTVATLVSDMKVGSQAARQWTDFRSATPIGHPTKNEIDDTAGNIKPYTRSFTGLALAAAHNITDAAHGSGTAIQNINSIRVVSVGTAAVGARIASDSGDTPSASVATISDDGTTITFEGTVSGFVIRYIPVGSVETNSRLWQP